jgi:hypothetical protein
MGAPSNGYPEISAFLQDKYMNGPQAICPKCGARYYGWALQTPRHQMCEICGAALVVRINGVLIRSKFSPVMAHAQQVDLNLGVWEDLCEKELSFHLTVN